MARPANNLKKSRIRFACEKMCSTQAAGENRLTSNETPAIPPGGIAGSLINLLFN